MNESVKQFLTRKNIIAGVILVILIVAVPISVYLVQQQQKLRSRAAGEAITFTGDGVSCNVAGVCTTTSENINISFHSPFGSFGTPPRRALCESIAVSPTTISSGQQIAITSTSKEANLKQFMYAFYNADNPKSVSDQSPNIICQEGLTEDKVNCPKGGGPLIIKIDAASTATSDIYKPTFTDFDKPDLNWGGKNPTHLQVNGYFIDQYGAQSLPEVPCNASFSLNTGATAVTPPTCSVTGPSTATIGQSVTYTATATGHGRDVRMVDIYIQKPNTSGLTAADFDLKGVHTCDNDLTCTVTTDSFSFSTAYTAPVTCNAYYQPSGFNGNKTDECSGNLAGVKKTGSGWSDCGEDITSGTSSRITTAVATVSTTLGLPTGLKHTCNLMGGNAVPKFEWDAVANAQTYLLRLNKYPYDVWEPIEALEWKDSTSDDHAITSTTNRQNITFDPTKPDRPYVWSVQAKAPGFADSEISGNSEVFHCP